MADAKSDAGQRIVTISGAFGAGATTVGPAVAEQLGLPFLDRAIPVAVARTLAVPVDAALGQDERRPSFIQRVIASMAAAGTPLGVNPTPQTTAVMPTHEMFKLATEQVLRELVTEGGGVVLGRAAAVVLAGHPNTLHVRLHGPRDARITRVMEHDHTDRESAAKLTDQTDRAWESYVHYFYKTDLKDARLYHLMIDTTVIPLDTCTQIIVTAAQGMAAGEGRAPGSTPGSSA